jgi:hypothetical protein
MGDCSRAGGVFRNSCSRTKLRLLPDTCLSIGTGRLWSPPITDWPRCNTGCVGVLSDPCSLVDGTYCSSGWLPRSKLGEDERELWVCTEDCLLRSLCACTGDFEEEGSPSAAIRNVSDCGSFSLISSGDWDGGAGRVAERVGRVLVHCLS